MISLVAVRTPPRATSPALERVAVRVSLVSERGSFSGLMMTFPALSTRAKSPPPARDQVTV